MDGERNDRLGRPKQQRQPFEHRREILRRWRRSDTHANIFSDPNRDSYSHGNCNANGDSAASIANPDGNSNSNAYGYTNSNCNSHDNAECDADSNTHPKFNATSNSDSALSSHTGASTIELQK